MASELKISFSYYDVSRFLENWLYLCKCWSIFFQILICSTLEYFLQMQSPRYFILTKASWRIFAIKGGMSIFHILRVFSMGHDFFSKLDSTFSSFASNISVVLSSFTLSFEYVVAEIISYHKCALYFSIRCRDHAHISLTKWDLIIPFSVTCNLYGKCFGISVTHLTSDLEVPGSSPGVSNNLFSSLFFLFWPFTVPSPLNIKTRTIANNVINNHIYFIITLLSLDPLLFACNPYGRWLCLNLDSTFLSFASNIAVILAWFLLIFEYVVAETIYYLKVLSFFQSDVIMVC